MGGGPVPWSVNGFHHRKWAASFFVSIGLAEFRLLLLQVTPTLKARLRMASKNFGSPTVLFIASGAMRVADATRIFKSKFLRQEKGGDAAKLFARHFKLEEHMAYLKRAKIGSGWSILVHIPVTASNWTLVSNFFSAVGTPGRIGKLLCESGKHSQTRQLSTFADQFTDALSVSALTHIIFDATYRDVKKRSLFDITETRDEVFRLVLGADSVRKAINQGKVQLVFFWLYFFCKIMLIRLSYHLFFFGFCCVLLEYVCIM